MNRSAESLSATFAAIFAITSTSLVLVVLA
jgi:hypothetical protein